MSNVLAFPRPASPAPVQATQEPPHEPPSAEDIARALASLRHAAAILRPLHLARLSERVRTNSVMDAIGGDDEAAIARWRQTLLQVTLFAAGATFAAMVEGSIEEASRGAS